MEYLQWMVNTVRNLTKQMLGSHANLLESVINLSVSIIILLFSVTAKFKKKTKKQQLSTDDYVDGSVAALTSFIQLRKCGTAV